jgi:hypothetical protein
MNASAAAPTNSSKRLNLPIFFCGQQLSKQRAPMAPLGCKAASSAVWRRKPPPDEAQVRRLLDSLKEKQARGLWSSQSVLNTRFEAA